ncbi:MAG: ABC transporter permease [Bacteroidia bacterium]|nr:ABC transporter permease [Bacteroidia bacterium]
MISIIKLACRNLRQNKLRSLTTVFNIGLAVSFGILVQSQQAGTYQYLLENTAKPLAGHLQAHPYSLRQNGKQSINQEPSANLPDIIDKHPGVRLVSPRMETDVLLTHNRKARLGRLLAVDLAKEKDLSLMPQSLIRGKFLHDTLQSSLLLTDGLAQFLKVGVGDSVKIVFPGYDVAQPPLTYLVSGIIQLPSQMLNQTLAYTSRHSAQSRFGSGLGTITYIILLDDPEDAKHIRASLNNKLISYGYELKTWQEMLPELGQMISLAKVGGEIIKSILYMLVGFELLTSLLILTAARRYEVALLLALGMNRFKCGLALSLEIFLINILGVVVGILCMIPLINYLGKNPIRLPGKIAQASEKLGLDPFIFYTNKIAVFWEASGTILALGAILSLYPIWWIYRINIAESLH